MGNWVEKQMDAEPSALRVLFTALAGGMACAALILFYSVMSPFLDGVHTLDSSEKAEKFSQRDYVYGVLPYRASLDTMGGVTIASPDRGVGGQISGGEADAARDYNVYRLAGEGFSVLYLTEGALKDTGSVRVKTINRDISRQLIRDFSPNGSNIYVLYEADFPSGLLAAAALLALASALLFGLRKSGFVRRRTNLGRSIAAIGDLRTVCHKMDGQAVQSRFDESGLTVLDDWVLFREYVPHRKAPEWTAVVPAGDVLGVDIRADGEDGETFRCDFNILGNPKPWTVRLKAEQAERLRALADDIARAGSE